MKEVLMLFRWDDGALGITGWGYAVCLSLALVIRKR